MQMTDSGAVKMVQAIVEPSIASAQADGKPVFNLAVGLKDILGKQIENTISAHNE
jgi:hypothetical protein